ncbi:MAG: hypothetical protein RL885_14210 [Planctomycetota bacterium]
MIRLWWLLLLPSCVSFEYSRQSLNEPIKPVAVSQLTEKEAGLQDCLNRLGAPNELWETPEGFAAVYGWYDQGAWNLTASANIRSVPLRFDYTSTNLDLRGVVLLFDRDAKLLRARVGRLAVITQDLRKRPVRVVSD